MNGFGLLLLVATMGQIASAPTVSRPPETDFGWDVHPDDGVLEYIIQVSPEEMEMLTKYGKEKTSAMPPELVGRATRIVVRIGSTVLPRTPSLQEIIKLPTVGSSASNATFPVAPPGFSAYNMKTVEPPTVYNVAGNNAPTLPSSTGNSTMPDRSIASGQDPKSSLQPDLPLIPPSLTIPDSSLLAQNSTAGSKFLESSRDPQASSRAPSSVQNSDKFHSVPKQTPSQQPASRLGTGASGSLIDSPNRDWAGAAQSTTAPLSSTTLPNALGTSGLPGSIGFPNQSNLPALMGGSNSQSASSTLPNYGTATNSSPATAADRWPPASNSGQVASQPYGLPGTQPVPQSPVPTFANPPGLPGTTPNYGQNAYNAPANYPGNRVGLAQPQDFSNPGYQGQQSTLPAANYPSNSGSGFAGQPQYDTRSAEDPGYIAQVAMNSTSAHKSFPTTPFSRSGDNTQSQLDRDYSENGRASSADSAKGRVDAESGQNVDGILQVFFLLSLVVNFYLGLLIRKVLARYRSLLSSVRSQTA